MRAECNGSDNSGGYKNDFKSIIFHLAMGDVKVANEYIFDNIKVEIPSSVLAGLTASPVTDPNYQMPYPTTLSDLIAEAQPLAQDNDAVAVGKLQAAIATAQAIASPADADIVALQAAIDQFAADNTVPTVDVTSKVGTAVDSWTNVQKECSQDFRIYNGGGHRVKSVTAVVK